MLTTTNNDPTFGFKILKAGVLSLIQDLGRTGQFNIGLTNGGPLDQSAFTLANRLCANHENTCAIEITAGGLELESHCEQCFAVTGANMPLTINNQPKQLWQTHSIKPGDVIKLGVSTNGLRSYLAVSGGFLVSPMFNSTSTVCREHIGGLNGGALHKHDFIKCVQANQAHPFYKIDDTHQPVYSNNVTLRVVLGYQHKLFSNLEKRLFFSSEYKVSEHFDRMGYRLKGRKIKSNAHGVLSEGICHGAIQIPNDGQPIVLLNDRQTIGGYPKIGSVIKLDTYSLGQTGSDAIVHFEEISMEKANNLFHLAQFSNKQIQLIEKK